MLSFSCGRRFGDPLNKNLYYCFLLILRKEDLHQKFRNYSEKSICDVLLDLVPFVQFKKRKEHPWESATFSKVAGF